MGISPWPVGQTAPILTWTLLDDSGVALPISGLTGSNFVLLIRNPLTGVDRTGTGTFSVTNGAAGQVQYTWSSADVATAGDYQLIVQITYANGRISYTDALAWSVVSI